MTEKTHSMARYSGNGGRGKDMLYTVEALGLAGGFALSFGGGAAAVCIILYVEFFGYSQHAMTVIFLLVTPIVTLLSLSVMVLLAYLVTNGRKLPRTPRKSKIKATPIQKNAKLTGYAVLREDDR